MGKAESRYPTTVAATWLAARMAVEPGSTEWRYPAWQFESGRPRPGVARVVAAARESGVDETRLYELLTTPLGLRDGGRRLADLLLEGRDDEVVAAVRSS
jgi:hypothetical protein